MNVKPFRRAGIINEYFRAVRPLVLLLSFVSAYPACGNAVSKTDNANNNQQTAVAADVRQSALKTKLSAFPMVDVPSALTSVEDRAAYLVGHYWDYFDFTDTTLTHRPEITEQGFVDYLSVLPHTTWDKARLSIQKMLTAAIEQDSTGRMYRYFLDLYKDYLHDPNSPLRNEEYYIPAAEYIVDDKVSDMATKERAGFDLKLMLKNRIGATAGDFTYLTINGKQGSLYRLNTDFILLYFNNPDCKACKEATAFLEESSAIRQLLKQQTLSILAVYPDEDVSSWQAYKGDIPPLWINARNAGGEVRNKLIYDLKAIPSLYLLDKQKTVLLKDADVKTVVDYLDTAIVKRE